MKFENVLKIKEKNESQRDYYYWYYYKHYFVFCKKEKNEINHKETGCIFSLPIILKFTIYIACVINEKKIKKLKKHTKTHTHTHNFIPKLVHATPTSRHWFKKTLSRTITFLRFKVKKSCLDTLIYLDHFSYGPTTDHSLPHKVRQRERIVLMKVKYTNLQVIKKKYFVSTSIQLKNKTPHCMMQA